MDVGFVGCASHRFNLAVQNMLAEHVDVILTVNAVNEKLRAPFQRRKLRHFTTVSPLISIDTRCLSTSHMLERFEEMRDFFSMTVVCRH